MENLPGIYTQEEQKRLEDNYNYRKKMVDFAFRDGLIPDGPKDVEAINNVLNSMDKAIVDAANARLKQQETMNKETTLNIVADMVKTIHKQQLEHKQQNRVLDVDDKFIPTNTVEGETDIIPENLNLDDILNKGDD